MDIFIVEQGQPMQKHSRINKIIFTPQINKNGTHLEDKRGYWNERSWRNTIETDRRIIKQKINLLKKKLTKINNQKLLEKPMRKYG